MKLRKVTALALAGIMSAIGLSGCGTSNQTAGGDKVYRVGICQLVQHEALDAATAGFKAVLTEKLGDKVVFDEQNAQGDSTTCSTITNRFVSDSVDLIFANATPALQAAYASTPEIPIVGTSITDYATALEIDDWSGATGLNVTGTSDLAPLEEQAAMFKELLPDAKKIGLIYCSNEANSKYQINIVAEELKKLGYETEEFSFSDSNDVAAVVTTACNKMDALYIPTDNTAASNTALIDSIAAPKNIPIISGEEGICQGCGVATLSISYDEIGRIAGEMAYEILVNGADPATMDIKFAATPKKKYDADRAKALGITVPDSYEAIVTD